MSYSTTDEAQEKARTPHDKVVSRVIYMLQKEVQHNQCECMKDFLSLNTILQVRIVAPLSNIPAATVNKNSIKFHTLKTQL